MRSRHVLSGCMGAYQMGGRTDGLLFNITRRKEMKETSARRRESYLGPVVATKYGSVLSFFGPVFSLWHFTCPSGRLPPFSPSHSNLMSGLTPF